MDLTFFNTLKIRLKENKNGHRFHCSFSPQNRDFFSANDKKAKKFTKSAIVILLFQREHRLKSILIERAIYPGVHSGQIGFPGGKYEKEDQQLITTAIRETFEEIGVEISPHDIIGKLSPVAIPISQFIVYPYISYITYTPTIHKDKKEVINTIEFDVMDFIEFGFIQQSKVKAVDKELTVPSFIINHHIVWGTTAMILNEFREIALSALRKPIQ